MLLDCRSAISFPLFGKEESRALKRAGVVTQVRSEGYQKAATDAGRIQREGVGGRESDDKREQPRTGTGSGNGG